jgi:hypothetical protein
MSDPTLVVAVVLLALGITGALWALYLGRADRLAEGEEGRSG